MAIQPFNYAALGAANMGQTDTAGSFMKGLQAGSMPKNIKQEQEQRELANALMAIQNQYAPQINESQLAQQGSQTNLNNQKAKYLPLDFLIQAVNSQRANNRFGGSYQLNKALQAMTPAQRATWQAQNPEAYSSMVNQIGNNVLNPIDENKQDLLGDELKKLFGGSGQQMQSFAPADSLTIHPDDYPKLANLLGASTGNGQPLPVNNNQPLPVNPDMMSKFSTSPEQVDELKKAAELSANKELVTTKTRNQLEGGIQLEEMMNSPEIQEKVKNASLYAGALGSGKAAVAALSQKNPAAYEDYISFINQDMPLIANRIKSLDAMGTTDKQREELTATYNNTMNAATSNPKQFIEQYNKLGEVVARVSKSVSKSASPVFPDDRIHGFNPIASISQGTQADALQKVMSPSSDAVRKYNPATGKIE